MANSETYDPSRQDPYGWVIVGAGLIISLSMYGVIESFAILFKPIAEQFDWDRGTVSMASMIGWTSFGVSSLVCGRLSDRYGSKWVIIVGTVLFVVGTFLMSQVHALWQLYVVFGVILAVGRSATGVPIVALVTKWFTKRQGLALALAQSQNVGSAVFAPLVVFLLANNDWQGTYIWLGVLALLVLPLAFLVRDKKEERTDAGGIGRVSEQPVPQNGPKGLMLGEAVRTRDHFRRASLTAAVAVLVVSILVVAG